MNREQMAEVLGVDEGEELLWMDGFDDCVLGVAERYVGQRFIVYDLDRVIEKLVKKGMSVEEAFEWWEFNMVGPGAGMRMRPRQFADWSALPEEELLSGEGKKALDEAIQTLPESLRIVFLLRDVEGLSIKDTAEALNLTENNVKTRLLRARMALREGLSAYYGVRLPVRSEK